MPLDRSRLRWNGWGVVDQTYDLGANEGALLGWLGERLDCDPRATRLPSAALDEVRLPAIRDAGLREPLAAAVGEDNVADDRRSRVLHAVGRSLPDVLRLRGGDPGVAPDLVVYPGRASEIAAVLRLAARHGFAVVPYGGGSSVVGGVEASDPRGRPVVTLDTTRLERRLDLDTSSHTCRFEAGVLGPALEESLGREGFTLGHFPQSFEHSTLGGWIAARSAGQQSNRYGRIDEMLHGVRLVTPRGEIETWRGPASAAGPSLNALVSGSEGILGVIVDATLQIHPVPASRRVVAVVFRDFAAGTAAVREISQADLRLSFLRLSDADETELYLRLGSRLVRRVGDLAFSALGYGARRAILLAGSDGERADVEHAVARAGRICRAHRGLPLGGLPARGWLRDRFRHPYLRDVLLERGVAIDTLETAAPWERIARVEVATRRAVEAALAAEGRRALVTAHLSHSYPTGTSLYFIILYPLDPARPVEQWRAIKRAATDALCGEGGTVSHHHGVGLDHRPWLAREKGEGALTALRGLKASLDPDDLLNPGKLLPASGA